MSQPKVTLTELDGALGALPEGTTKPMVFVGVSDSGPIDTPAAFGKGSAIEANFGAGPLVEAACFFVETYGIPAIVVRTGQSVDGSYLDEVAEADGTISAFDNTLVTGTTNFSDDATTPSDPLVTADWKIVVQTGGTIGVAGIVLLVYVKPDGEDEWSLQQIISLGVDTDFTVTGTGVEIDVSAGTLVAGDVATFSTTAHVEASAGELVITGAGSASHSIDSGTTPNDDYEIVIEYIDGGTRGVDGITYKESRDGGRNFTAKKALGTATSITVADTGGVIVDIGAGTINAGQTVAFPTVAPLWNNTELGTALDVAKASVLKKGIFHIVGPIGGSAFDLIETKLAGKKYAWVGNTRTAVGAETEANYLASLAGVFSARASKNGMLCAGACWHISQVSGNQYRRPAAFALGALQGSVSEEVNIANADVGLLPGCAVRDENGNVVVGLHDETANPGLDDARFATLRTWDDEVGADIAGVYPNRPRLFSPENSDFYLMPHRLVMNLAHATVSAYFARRLSKEVVVSRKTGYMLESEALEIESGATNAMRSVLLAKPKASDAYVVLSRTDNLLAKAPMTGRYRVVPLAYPENAELEGAFENPALNVKAV